MESYNTIKELLKVIAMQQEEIQELEERIDRIKEYLDVYEEYLKRGEY